MQLEQHFELAFPRPVVWEAFHDIDMLVGCLPGAALAGPADARPLALSFQVRLGPITAAFHGQGEVRYEDDHVGVFEGQGADRKSNSRVKGQARFSLLETAAGCEVRIAVDYALTGSLAQFSRGGLIKEIAAGITAQFAANLRERLSAMGESSAATAAGTPAPDAAPVQSAAPPAGVTPAAFAGTEVKLGRLIWGALLARIKRLFVSNPSHH